MYQRILIINHFYRYGKVSSAQIVYDKAPEIVDSKDGEGNTPHMLAYKHNAGATCQTLLG